MKNLTLLLILSSILISCSCEKEDNPEPVYYLGQEYLDGIVYYLYTDSTGQQHGLVVATTDTIAKWQNTAVETFATRTWDGSYNTNLMTDSPAKNWVQSHGSNWYIPSIDELILLWHNRFHANSALSAGNYTLLSNDATYWSSTEVDTHHSFNLSFFYGTTNYYDNNKLDNYRVRGIRAF